MQAILGQGHDIQTEQEAAEKIIRASGGLPLLIATIATYIHDNSGTLPDFIASFNESGPFWSNLDVQLTWHEGGPPETAFDTALENLDLNSTDIIRIMALLHGDFIPEQFLLGPHNHGSLTFLNEAKSNS